MLQIEVFFISRKKVIFAGWAGWRAAGVKRNIRGRRGVGFGLGGRKVVIFLVDVFKAISQGAILSLSILLSPYARADWHISSSSSHTRAVADNKPVNHV
jgi:hypothetical protein